MSIKSLFFALFLFSFIGNNIATAQNAYQIIDSEGKVISFEKMVQKIDDADVIFFGEIHNQPIAHYLNLELIKAIYERDSSLLFGMEMFEKDQQRVLSEMLSGIFPVDKLSKYTRTWSNFSTDYLPLVKYCRSNGISVQATNIPRQYASFVFSHGIDSLYSLDVPLDLLPPGDLPIDTSLVSYSEIQDMAAHMGHGGGYFLEAQAIKDMMMAYSIHTSSHLRQAGAKYIHTNGVFHTKYKEGIAWYLNYLEAGLSIKVISCHEIDDFENFQIEDHDKADYHILIDADITKSYD